MKPVAGAIDDRGVKNVGRTWGPPARRIFDLDAVIVSVNQTVADDDPVGPFADGDAFVVWKIEHQTFLDQGIGATHRPQGPDIDGVGIRLRAVAEGRAAND